MADSSRVRTGLAAAAIAALALGCAGQTPQPTSTAPASQASRHGYALLFDLMAQQKDVSKLLIIKRERPELRDLIQAIARSCEEAHDRLQELAEADPSLDLEDRGLPTAEVETREAIKKTRTQLLLTESGEEFELQLLLAQNEALSYAVHLSEVLARTEPDLARLEFARALWKQLRRQHAEVLALLRTRYRWTPPQG